MSLAGKPEVNMEDYFQSLAAIVQNALQAGERFTASLDAEETDFVRMNRGKVRQPGTVAQRYLTLRLIRDARHGEHSLSLTGDLGADASAVRDAVAGLRAVLPELADDPLLLLPTEVRSSRNVRGTSLPPSEVVIDEVLAAAGGLDLVGIYAAGPVWRGFANSEGQRNWHATNTFNLQWSLYHRADKAVKTGHAGFAWDATAFEHKMAQAREALPEVGMDAGAFLAHVAQRLPSTGEAREVLTSLRAADLFLAFACVRVEAWALEARYLALGLVNVILTLSPPRVVLGGGVLARAGLLERVRGEVTALIGGYVRSPEIVAPLLGLLGTAADREPDHRGHAGLSGTRGGRARRSPRRRCRDRSRG